jgi:predicted DNA-binding ribbon-helix-helix protein
VEAMLARLKPLWDALKAKQIAPNDTQTGAQLTEELYDEHGPPR